MREGSIGVLIVGAGSAGRQHAAAIAESDAVRVVGYVDPDASQQLAGVPRMATLGNGLADPGVDLVALCTPPGGRSALAGQAIAAGKGILLEKPPASDVDDLDRLIETADSAGVALGVMLQHRLALGRWVDVVMPRASALVEVSRPRPAARYADDGWRSDRQTALGGITAHLGVHYLDAACQILGELVDVSILGIECTEGGIDLRVSGAATFAAGGHLAFVVTSGAARRQERLVCHGPERTLAIEDGVLTVDDDAPAPARSAGRLRSLVYEEMAQAIRTGRPPATVDARRARSVMQILAGVRRASRHG